MKNMIAFVNGAYAQAKEGKKETFINLKGTWYTKTKLEKLGCKVIIRTGRN